MGIKSEEREYSVHVDPTDFHDGQTYGFERWSDGLMIEKRMDEIIINAANNSTSRTSGKHYTWTMADLIEEPVRG